MNKVLCPAIGRVTDMANARTAMAHLEGLYNPPQLEAIHAALTQDGMTLIQVHKRKQWHAKCQWT